MQQISSSGFLLRFSELQLQNDAVNLLLQLEIISVNSIVTVDLP